MAELAISTMEATREHAADSVPAAQPNQQSLAPQTIPLKKLRAGQLATIAALQGSSQESARLAEMGLHRGTDVVVIRNGITCILQLNNHRICVRLSKELKILVTPFS